jgi:hypothetical protein
MEQIVTGILALVGLYLLLGILFSVFFFIKGIKKIDEGTVDANRWFRLIILPGVFIFWPSLLSKWLKANKQIN